jgi:hypothetical protein
MFTRTLFCTENSFAIISQTYENTVKRYIKAKIRLLQILLSFAFYSRHQLKQQDLGKQLTNKCSQELYFVLKTALPLFPRPMKHCYAKNDAKIDFCKFFEFCIFYSHN